MLFSGIQNFFPATFLYDCVGFIFVSTMNKIFIRNDKISNTFIFINAYIITIRWSKKYL
jgi:hypothetical protein